MKYLKNDGPKRFFSLVLLVILIYFSYNISYQSHIVYGVEAPPHIYQFETMHCWNISTGEYLGDGFYCEWPGNDCWACGFACPPDWNFHPY